MQIFSVPSVRRAAMFLALLLSPAVLFSVTSASGQIGEDKNAKKTVTLTGLIMTDATVGTGASPKVGQTCVINYTTWLYVNGAKGDKVESSLDNGQPVSFLCGKGQVRREWDEGVATMKAGGKRTIVSPAQVGITPPTELMNQSPRADADRNDFGRPSKIVQPPGLVFDIELLDVR